MFKTIKHINDDINQYFYISRLSKKISSNDIYLLREDTIPYYMGGNKVRIGSELLLDAVEKGFDSIVTYGSPISNLSRVVAGFSNFLHLPCYVVVNNENKMNESSVNLKFLDLYNANVVCCDNFNVSSTINKVLEECKNKNLKPYYVYGDKDGHGNENVFTSPYFRIFSKIINWEKKHKLKFDYICFASGTGSTQAGLILGKSMFSTEHNIVGFSIARCREKGIKEIMYKIDNYLKVYDLKINISENQINFIDDYNYGYAVLDDKISQCIRDIYFSDNICMDPYYVGKAFTGMEEYLIGNNITGKNVLFIHTGSSPLFYQYLLNKS